jgi:hypothetical protein
MSRGFFLGGKLGQLLTKKQRGSELSTGSFGEKGPKIAKFPGEKSENRHI